MSSKIEKISPHRAAEYLKHNTHNRPISESNVDKLAATMRRGEWELNGEAIKFNCDGTLIDGQKRLLACIKSNTTITTYVTRGLDKSCFKTLDGQQKRQLADAFSIIGKKNRTTLAGAIRALWNLTPPVRTPGTMMRGETLTQTQGLEMLEKHPNIERSVGVIMAAEINHITQGSVMSALHYLMAEKDAVMADTFFVTIGSGENISKRDPEYQLRKQLLDARTTKFRMMPAAIAALTIKAWNARRSGKPISQLRFSSNESFPEIL